MKRDNNSWIAIISIAVMFIGCAMFIGILKINKTIGETETSHAFQVDQITRGLIRVIDYETGMACYYNKSGGVQCGPLSSPDGEP